MNIATKVALRDALRAAAADDRRTGGAAHRHRDRAFCVGPGPQGAHRRCWPRPASRARAARMSTVQRALQPDRAGAHRDGRSRWWPGSTASRPGPGFGFALAADYRVVADTASFNTSFAGVALTADSGRLLDAAAADRPEPRRRPAALPAQRSPRRRRYELGIANRVVPGGRAGRRGRSRWPGRWPRARRWRTRRSRSPWPTAPPTRWPRPWRRRTSSRPGRARREDHAIAVQAFVNKEKPKYLGR